MWGDPSLYDSTLRIIDHVIQRANVKFEYEVIPGITSVQALAARHKIVLNGVGESVCITTGRQIAGTGVPRDMENVVVMLDGTNSYKNLVDQDLEIYWGAYVGTDKEILLTEDSMTLPRKSSRHAAKPGNRTAGPWISIS